VTDMGVAETWKNLSNWRKGVLGIVTIMWLTFSSAIISALGSSLPTMILALCLLWLLFIAVAYFVIEALDNLSAA
jgi:hypothetical protein